MVKFDIVLKNIFITCLPSLCRSRLLPVNLLVQPIAHYIIQNLIPADFLEGEFTLLYCRLAICLVAQIVNVN